MSCRADGARRGAPARTAAIAIAAVFGAVPACAAAAEAVALEALRGRIESEARLAFTARGLEISVERHAALALPFAAQELELDLEADGPMLLSWAARSRDAFRPYGPPWRYATVPRARATIRADLRIAHGWRPSAQPVLLLRGTGTVLVHAMRARPPSPDSRQARAALDRALLWAPEGVGHTTINFLTPSFWSASRGIWLSDVVAGAALAVFVAALAASWIRRRRARPGLALAGAALFALLAWDAHFLVRFLPVANLRLEPHPDARIRRNYSFHPELGALAALARETLAPGERVGAMGSPRDWFGPQTLCFNLAPRPCAILRPGEAVHAGISGVGRLRQEELDAVVSIHGGPLPEGFEPVAAVNPDVVVARRR